MPDPASSGGLPDRAQRGRIGQALEPVISKAEAAAQVAASKARQEALTAQHRKLTGHFGSVFRKWVSACCHRDTYQMQLKDERHPPERPRQEWLETQIVQANAQLTNYERDLDETDMRLRALEALQDEIENRIEAPF